MKQSAVTGEWWAVHAAMYASGAWMYGAAYVWGRWNGSDHPMHPFTPCTRCTPRMQPMLGGRYPRPASIVSPRCACTHRSGRLMHTPMPVQPMCPMRPCTLHKSDTPHSPCNPAGKVVDYIVDEGDNGSCKCVRPMHAPHTSHTLYNPIILYIPNAPCMQMCGVLCLRLEQARP